MVDDGSRDDPGELLAGLPVHLLRCHAINLGQGRGLADRQDYAKPAARAAVVHFDAMANTIRLTSRASWRRWPIGADVCARIALFARRRTGSGCPCETAAAAGRAGGNGLFTGIVAQRRP